MDPTPSTPARRYRIVCQQTGRALIQHGLRGHPEFGPYSLVEWYHGTLYTSVEATAFARQHKISSQEFSITTRNPNEQTAQ